MKTTNCSEIATLRNTVAILGEYQNNSEKVGVFTCARHGEEEKRTEKKKKNQKTNQSVSQNNLAMSRTKRLKYTHQK